MIALAGLIVFRTTNIKNIVALDIVSVFSIFAVASILSLILGILLHGAVELPMIKRGSRWAERIR
jgi:peptidoglycan/LPS O-acetylase OafA/YrhL